MSFAVRFFRNTQKTIRIGVIQYLQKRYLRVVILH